VVRGHACSLLWLKLPVTQPGGGRWRRARVRESPGDALVMDGAFGVPEPRAAVSALGSRCSTRLCGVTEMTDARRLATAEFALRGFACDAFRLLGRVVVDLVECEDSVIVGGICDALAQNDWNSRLPGEVGGYFRVVLG
jgi:hypothetical protein